IVGRSALSDILRLDPVTGSIRTVLQGIVDVTGLDTTSDGAIVVGRQLISDIVAVDPGDASIAALTRGVTNLTELAVPPLGL
ncbi:MAG: hypothetical protein HRU01_23275, partial [Myxococcales bacterium]|nr:hypothetical protein [Myxococcales bacterium]